MKSLLKTVQMQFKLMTTTKSFLLGMSINFVYVFITYMYYVINSMGHDISTVVSPSAVFPLNTGSAFFDVYINIVPFLVVLPFSMSYLTDKNNCALPMIQSRSSVGIYYTAKSIVCFLGGGLVFIIPMIVSVCLNTITFPASGITPFGDLFDMNFDLFISGANIVLPTIWKGLWLPRLFIFSPEMYAILFSILFSLFAGVLSLFTFSVSLVIKRFKILLFLPAYLFITLTNTLDSLFYNGNNFMSYKIFQYVTVNAQFGKNPLFLAVVVMLLLSISVVLIIRQAHIDQLD